MPQALARYHARSPRYILNTKDDFLIRVAGPRQTPWEENTLIRDVSLTGLSFTAPADLCPLLGEVIKIQFQIPGPTPEQTACHAIVTRLDDASDEKAVKVVGVHFYRMEMSHRILLAQGLSHRFREQMSENSVFGEGFKARFSKLLHRSFTMSVALWLWVGLMALFLNFF